MRLSLVSVLLPACVASEAPLWGQGSCDYPMLYEHGHVAKIASDVVLGRFDCAKGIHGNGPWERGGNDIPDCDRNAWAVEVDKTPATTCSSPARSVRFTILISFTHLEKYGDHWFQRSGENLCNDSMRLDCNVQNNHAGTANDIAYTVQKLTCGFDSNVCPSVGSSEGFAPGGVYSSVFSCGPQCSKWEYAQYDTCS